MYLPSRASQGKQCLSNSRVVLKERQVTCRKRIQGDGGGEIIQGFPYFHITEFNFLEVTAVNDKQECARETPLSTEIKHD